MNPARVAIEAQRTSGFEIEELKEQTGNLQLQLKTAEGDSQTHKDQLEEA